jgi:hypothetical protein
MNIHNIHTKRTKYFYTVLFLNNYYPKKQVLPEAEVAATKLFEICADTNTSNIKWLTPNKLWVRHNMKYPLTLEMWNAQDEPIFYCPILKENVDSLTVGDVAIESGTSIVLNFTTNLPPKRNEVFKLAMRSLPAFDLKNQHFEMPKLPLDQRLDEQTGLAIVFRRNTLDALFDLIAEFDETYWHSMEQTFDLQYLTQESCYKDCYFAGKYTNELQDVLDIIDVTKYNIKYSWENLKQQAMPDYYN